MEKLTVKRLIELLQGLPPDLVVAMDALNNDIRAIQKRGSDGSL